MDYLSPIGFLVVAILYTHRVSKNITETNSFYATAIWSAIALFSFCILVASFVFSALLAGIVSGFIFVASLLVTLKFRNAVTAT
ncbi:hypothetical protein J7384_16910 [Endozoicomonas sp. G2_1]|uniref:hypothetical protein n=1 Tax=Endozoicomonas sp. G2_1 TaxID=2821091 RepID=UPI001ADC7595|nr:hypothetical protein [Endozoicomonas sp. G2_1]MBO9492044.1 hypothetical protein [Endozoicomonas sp. G2_1]